MTLTVFPQQELADRLRRVRREMEHREMDCLLVSKPENILYLAGLDHLGYFALHVLVVPLEGRPVLITREMERATIEDQQLEAEFVGFSDSEPAERCIAGVMLDLGVGPGVGIEKQSSGMPVAVYEGLCGELKSMQSLDASGLVDQLRFVKSPLELEYMRAAARVTDEMFGAAMQAIQVGASETDVAAEVHRRMVLAGGEPPGFTPFIRPASRIHQEHTTWSNERLQHGDALFLEMSGCVGRYHAPAGRLVHLGQAPDSALIASEACENAFQSVVDALRPDNLARDVYAQWQASVEHSGIRDYRRHHCGYMVGIGYPPSWTGGSQVIGLRSDSDMRLEAGMSFHILSWILGSNIGDCFLSNTVVVTEQGGNVLTHTPVRTCL